MGLIPSHVIQRLRLVFILVCLMSRIKMIQLRLFCSVTGLRIGCYFIPHNNACCIRFYYLVFCKCFFFSLCFSIKKNGAIMTVSICLFVCLSIMLTPSVALHGSASVAQLDAPSDWRPGGRGFNPCRGWQHSFMEIDHEIFSMVILSLPLIQVWQLSISGERMCKILVNRLED